MLRDLNTDFTLNNCLFGSVKLTKNADPEKYKYSGYGIGFDSRSEFLFTDGSMGNNAIIFGADMSSSVHADNKNKNILFFGEGSTQRLDDTTITAEVEHPINFTQPDRRFVLSLHYNGINSFLFVNTTKIYQFIAKSCKFFCFDFNPVDTNVILDIHKYFMKKTWYKIMFGLINKIFIGSFLVNGSNRTKCVSLSNQTCEIQPTLINLHPN